METNNRLCHKRESRDNQESILEGGDRDPLHDSHPSGSDLEPAQKTTVPSPPVRASSRIAISTTPLPASPIAQSRQSQGLLLVEGAKRPGWSHFPLLVPPTSNRFFSQIPLLHNPCRWSGSCWLSAVTNSLHLLPYLPSLPSVPYSADLPSVSLRGVGFSF
jgi:hypothetical protein